MTSGQVSFRIPCPCHRSARHPPKPFVPSSLVTHKYKTQRPGLWVQLPWNIQDTLVLPLALHTRTYAGHSTSTFVRQFKYFSNRLCNFVPIPSLAHPTPPQCPEPETFRPTLSKVKPKPFFPFPD